MAQAIESVVLSMYETFNKRDWNRIPTFTSPNCATHDMATGRDLRGVDGMKQWLTDWSTICSDMKAEVKVVAKSDTTVTIEGNGYGHNDGVIKTPKGTLPATGKPLHIQWVDLCEVKDGKIAAIRSYYDAGQIMAQLGVPA